MVGKKWEIICMYKDMLIYRKNGCLEFGNKNYTNGRAISVRSAKNLITRYINKLSKRDKRSLSYIKYNV